MISTIDGGPDHGGRRIATDDHPAATDVAGRRHLLFPAVTAQQIGQWLPFGAQPSWNEGALLFDAGTSGAGMFVVLSGAVIMTCRDGLDKAGWTGGLRSDSLAYSESGGFASGDVRASSVEPVALGEGAVVVAQVHRDRRGQAVPAAAPRA